MYDLSVLIPSRNEQFLSRTIEDILANIEGNTEIIVGLDGLWAEPPILDNPRVTIVHVSESIGQRAMTNQLARLSSAKYLMKVDAHCAFDKGFDRKLMEAIAGHDDWTVAPTMRNLHAFNWVCPDGHIRYQGPSGPCKECGKETKQDIVWIAKTNPQSCSYCFDPEPHFQYFNEFKNRPEGKGDITESMSLQGSCFMLTREKYWELNICDEAFGSWGSQGIEVACKTWLSGGKVMIIRNTWYAHLFRTQGQDFGFPYPISGKQVDEAKKNAGNKLYENKWPLQIYPSSWLIDRFWPVPGWGDSDRARITEAGTSFIDTRFEELRVLGIIPSIPGSMTDHATPVSPDRRREKMAVVAMGLSKLFSGCSTAFQNIVSVRDELQVGRIATQSVIANVVKDGNFSSLTTGDITNQPSVHQAMDTVADFVNPDVAIPVSSPGTSPNPTLSNGVDFNFSKDSVDGLNGDVHNTSIPSKGVLYYTDNLLPMSLALPVRHYIKKSHLPITSVSLKAIKFGNNIVLPLERGYLTMAKQILAGLEAMKEDVVYFCEHDVLYHPSHFEFTPQDKEKWDDNGNYWMLRLPDGLAIKYNVSPLSGLVVYRETAIKHFKERITLMESRGDKLEMLEIGFEPFTHRRIDWQFKCTSEIFMSKEPLIDIAHGANVTKKRWSKDQFRRQPTFWEEANIDHIPAWPNLREVLS